MYDNTATPVNTPLMVTVFDVQGNIKNAPVEIPQTANYIHRLDYKYDLGVLDSGNYIVSGNEGHVFPDNWSNVGEYREFVLYDPNPKPIVRGNSLYTIVEGPSWTEAEANSVKLGGHLVTINDAKENNWIAENHAFLGKQYKLSFIQQLR